MITVVIVDDEALIRSGFEMILAASDDIEVVGTSDGEGAVELVTEVRPDVLLLDIRMPGRDGLQVLDEVRRLPQAPVVAILTTFDTDDHIAQALGGGAAGFLVKDTDPDELPGMVRTLAGGGIVLSPAVSRHVIGHYLAAQSRTSSAAVGTLTDRERQVLILLAEGGSNTQIARAMFLSVGTVKDHVSTILAKLRVATRLQAAIVAERAGLTATGTRP